MGAATGGLSARPALRVAPRRGWPPRTGPRGPFLFRSAGDFECRQAPASVALVFVLTGAFELRHGSDCNLVDANHAVWQRAGERLDAAQVVAPLLCLHLHLPPALAEVPGEAPWRATLGPLPLRLTLDLLRLERLADHDGDLRGAERRVFDLAAGALCRARPGTPGTRSAAGRVDATKAILSRRLGDRLTLDEVAREVYTSRFHLARQFGERAGASLHRYLLDLRLKHALVRLAAGEGNVMRLAHELGFSSHSHLTKAMRGALGVTPSAVRAELCRHPGAVLR